MLEELIPIGFELLGSSLDVLSTMPFCLKHGIECETNISARTYMEKFGVKKGLKKHELMNQARVLGLTFGFYFLDNALGIQNQEMNFHKAFPYIFGSFRYLAALSNYIELKIENRRNERDSPSTY
jgi:hypothetical protein